MGSGARALRRRRPGSAGHSPRRHRRCVPRCILNSSPPAPVASPRATARRQRDGPGHVAHGYGTRWACRVLPEIFHFFLGLFIAPGSAPASSCGLPRMPNISEHASRCPEPRSLWPSAPAVRFLRLGTSPNLLPARNGFHLYQNFWAPCASAPTSCLDARPDGAVQARCRVATHASTVNRSRDLTPLEQSA